jgi:hypothetical protein
MISTGIIGIGTTSVLASALAEYPTPGITIPPPSNCFVSVLADLETAGPIVPGFLSFSASGLGQGDPAHFSLFGTGIAVAGTCGEFGCHPQNGLVAFMLGTPFEISVDASASANNVGCCDGSSAVQFSIQAYDACGVPQTISVETPDPGTAWLAVAGIAVLCGFCRIQPRSLRSARS